MKPASPRVLFLLLGLCCGGAGVGCVYSTPQYLQPPGFSSSRHRYMLEQQRVRMQTPSPGLPIAESGQQEVGRGP